jgi:paraquat-inducible protein A
MVLAGGDAVKKITAHSPENWRACPQCGFISTLPKTELTLVAACPRCHSVLWRMRRHPFEVAMACGLSGVLFYWSVLVAPFLEISAYGRFQQANIATGPTQLINEGFEFVGFLVLAVTVIFPGVKLGILLTTLIGIETRLVSKRFLRALFRWYAPISPWAMIDVYLLGLLVAYTRLTALASVHLDTALFGLIGLMVSMAATDATLDAEAVWRTLDQKKDDDKHLPDANRKAELIGCRSCELVNLAAPGTPCRRCSTILHRYKVDSVSRTWALLIAAVFFYVPANVYPVMTITQLGTDTPYTILGGIKELLDAGMWPLALLVFCASMVIPLMKIITLGYLLIQTQLHNGSHLLGRTIAYKIVMYIGRWSMIDVFMISILVALLRFAQFTNVRAEIGAPCFASVVVLTMFAAEFFDPKLMWNAKNFLMKTGGFLKRKHA